MLFACLGLVRMVKTCSFQIVTIAIANRVDRQTDGNFSLEFRASGYSIGNPGSLCVTRDITWVNIENI